MPEARCLGCGKSLLISPDVTKCFLCGGELEIRKSQTSESPMRRVIESVAERVVEISNSSPSVKGDLKKMLEAEG